VRALSLAVVLVLAGAISPPPAGADTNADEAELRFVRGAALFKAGRFDEALLEFLASNRLVPNRNVVFNIARSYEALDQLEEAYRYYAEYIGAETDKEERRAAQKRLDDLAPRVALLKIDSQPPGATVFLERVDLGGRGETPLLIAVPPGDHTVILKKPGAKTTSVAVKTVRGAETPLLVKLDPVLGTLRLTSRPAAAVYVDRIAGARTPPLARSTPALVKLPPGRHTLELEAPGYRTHRTDVVILANRETPLDLMLEEKPPPSGSVVLASDTPGALVTIDGAARGFTPTVLSLGVGRHEIEVRGDGYRPWRRTVLVARDGRSFYQVELEPAEQEVTGATRSIETLSTAPASVTLVSKGEIWAFGYQRLTEAVSSVRGLYASDDLNYEAIGIRGFSRPGDYTNRVLVVRDGHPMNDNWAGSGAVGRDFAPELDDVSRVEIVRGPGSTFFGPGAFFGVIQVVSDPPGVGPPVRGGGNLSSSGGATAFAHGSQTAGPVAASLHASVYDSEGRTLRFDEFRETPSRGEVVGADGEQAYRTALRLAAGTAALDAQYSYRSKDVPTAPFATVFDPAQNDETDRRVTNTEDRRGYVEGRWRGGAGPIGIETRGAYDYQSYDGVFPYDDGTGDSFVFTDAGGGRWLTGETRLSFTGFSQKLTIGGEVASHRVEQSFDDLADGSDDFSDEREFTNASAYGVEQVNLGERAIISAGVRADRFGWRNDVAVSPRLGLVVKPYRGGYTKAVAGRAFRSPSTYELFYNDDGLTQVAPESLDPETVWTGELEHTHELDPRSYVIASLFGSQIRDLINLGVNEDGLLEYENSSDEILAIGGEVELRLTARSGAFAGLAASYARLETDAMAQPPDLSPIEEVNSASVAGAVRGFWPVLAERLGLAAEVVYNSPRPRRDGTDAAPAVLTRVYASGRLRGTGLLYRLGVTNVLDWDWSAPVGPEYRQQSIRQEPRTVHAQVIYQID
jgi:outer membrane receptor for ferrienterochelin and colicins